MKKDALIIIGTFVVFSLLSTEIKTAASSTLVHDIAVTDVSLSKTLVGRGYCIGINVAILNEGDFTETVHVTVYADITVYADTNGAVHLIMIIIEEIASGSQKTVTFVWNTSDFAKGSYAISAYVPPVLGETHTEDNTYEDGSVVVTVPGDFNGDYTCNYKDLFLLALNYGKNIPPASPNFDINGDRKIDYKDLFILTANYGTDP